MKNRLLQGVISLLFIVSCGSHNANKTYAISDDGNGTKSPRIKEVIFQTSDNNQSEETITQYSYNNNNLLISKKTSYTHKRASDENNTNEDTTEITFTYNMNRQMLTRKFHDLTDIFNRNGNSAQYFYDDIIHKDTQLPIISSEKISARDTSCERNYTYTIDANNDASTIKEIETLCLFSSPVVNYKKINTYTYTYTQHNKVQSITNKQVTHNLGYDKNGNLIITNTYSSNSSTIFTYDTQNNISQVVIDNILKIIYIYDKNNLLLRREHYSRPYNASTDTYENVFKLDYSQIYTYENKKHYYKRVPNSLDIGFRGP